MREINNRILDKINFMEANFMTTSPDVLKFLSNTKSYFIPIHPIVLLKHLKITKKL